MPGPHWRGVLLLLLRPYSTSMGQPHKECGISPVFANFRQPKPLDLTPLEGPTRPLYPTKAEGPPPPLGLALGPAGLYGREVEGPSLYPGGGERGEGRIIRGQLSQRGAWPWQVSVRLSSARLGEIGHWCGGVLLDRYWVLTAAHCVKNALVEALGGGIWTAVVGDWDRSVNSGEERSMVVARVVVHPNFTEYRDDIALLELPRPAPPSLAPACLPTASQDSLQGLRCVATGWGQTVKNGSLEARLHQVGMRIVSNTACSQVYSLQYGISIGPGHLCAGPGEQGGQTGTCVGDSGGPLQCNLKDGRWYLAGITSFGSGCAKPGFPDVFVRVSQYVDWIQGVMGQALPR